MKKKSFLKTTVAICIFTMFSLSGCAAVTGNGSLTTQEITLPKGFAGARTMSPIDIVVDPSLTDMALLEGDSNVLEHVEVTEEDGLLVVQYKPKTMVASENPVKLRIPYFGGGTLETSSSGNIVMDGDAALTGDTFYLRVNSTGSINVAVEAKELFARSSSSGSITVKGSSQSAFIELSSTGSYFGFDCAIGDARVQLSSLGSAEVNVSTKLSGGASSLGSVTYKGDPAEITFEGGNVKHQ